MATSGPTAPANASPPDSQDQTQATADAQRTARDKARPSVTLEQVFGAGPVAGEEPCDAAELGARRADEGGELGIPGSPGRQHREVLDGGLAEGTRLCLHATPTVGGDGRLRAT